MSDINRRSFLKSMGAIGGATSMTSALTGMLSVRANADEYTSAPVDDGGYKALVAIFLAGGNDCANTLIPIDDYNYPIYAKYRDTIALPKSQILPLTPTTPLEGVIQYGIHPNLTNLSKMFHAKNMAVLQNVGTLLMPTTKDMFYKEPTKLPTRIFSHNDQMDFWQTLMNNSPSFVADGWGSLAVKNQMLKNSKPLFSSINATGSGRYKFLASKGFDQFVLNSGGAVAMNGYGASLFGASNVGEIIDKIANAPYNNMLEQEMCNIFNRSRYAQEILKPVFSNKDFDTYFTANGLSNQFKTVVKCIAANATLGIKRQVFAVVLGGFDNHSNLLNAHGNLMKQLDTSIGEFYTALNAIQMQDRVTSFTMSEFGRTFSSNGDGSDHAWGAHHFIIGGGVKGGEIYGKTPQFGVDTIDDVGRGRLIPTTSVDQYVATLCRWFGVNDNDMARITPNLKNFPEKYLKFL